MVQAYGRLLGGEFSEGFTVTPGDVPLSDIESPLEDSRVAKTLPTARRLRKKLCS